MNVINGTYFIGITCLWVGRIIAFFILPAEKEEYKANKDIIDNYVNRMTKSVNDTFAKNPLEFYNSRIFGLGTQTELANVIDTGDVKTSRDGKDEATIKSITDLIKMDIIKETSVLTKIAI